MGSKPYLQALAQLIPHPPGVFVPSLTDSILFYPMCKGLANIKATTVARDVYSCCGGFTRAIVINSNGGAVSAEAPDPHRPPVPTHRGSSQKQLKNLRFQLILVSRRRCPTVPYQHSIKLASYQLPVWISAAFCQKTNGCVEISLKLNYLKLMGWEMTTHLKLQIPLALISSDQI